MGLLDLVFEKDGRRRFIKRKDSDAGATGQALEEILGSLFNELRTSEGAKRQQQRFCGPTVAMTFNFMVSVGIILANKLVMGKVGFNFPIFLTLIHYTSAWILLAIFRALSLLPVSPPSKSTPFSSLFALGTVMAFSIGLANISLKHNIVGFYQMAKIAVTPTIVFAEFILFRKKDLSVAITHNTLVIKPMAVKGTNVAKTPKSIKVAALFRKQPEPSKTVRTGPSCEVPPAGTKNKSVRPTRKISPPLSSRARKLESVSLLHCMSSPDVSVNAPRIDRVAEFPWSNI